MCGAMSNKGAVWSMVSQL